MVYAIQSVGADLRSDRLTVEEALSAWKSQLHSRYEPSDVEELTRAIEVSEADWSTYSGEGRRTRSLNAKADPGRAASRTAEASIAARFNVKGYFLSAELILHVRDNTKKNSSYTPRTKAPSTNSKLVRVLGKKTRESGSSEFKNAGGVREALLREYFPLGTRYAFL
jgi:hypothetical protein